MTPKKKKVKKPKSVKAKEKKAYRAYRKQGTSRKKSKRYSTIFDW